MSLSDSLVLVSEDGSLTKSGLHLLIAFTKADPRVVQSEWDRWRSGASASSAVRQLIRIAAAELEIAPPDTGQVVKQEATKRAS